MTFEKGPDQLPTVLSVHDTHSIVTAFDLPKYANRASDHTAALKLLQFWPKRAEVQFAQVEAQSLTTRLNELNWIDQLPWLMLGIHTTTKENFNTSSTEIVSGVPLTVLGEFFLYTGPDPNVQDYLAHLRDSVGQLRPTPMSTHGTPRSFATNDLHKPKFEFVHRDTRRKILQ
uniref:Uncharacterized protein n=1 Tax=Octopus bimaculoides TaxID=37653 RepID=A0A0L8GBD5_OCTBM